MLASFMTPEDQARRNIDSLLQQSGWIVQDRSGINLSAGRGVAIREVGLRKGHGETDYLLFADGKAIGIVEAEPGTGFESFEEHVRKKFNDWIEAKARAGTVFTPDQMTWPEKMRDYISASGSVDREHLETDDVLGPIYKAFGEKLWPLMEELNLALAE
jgi:hypothetical protein